MDQEKDVFTPDKEMEFVDQIQFILSLNLADEALFDALNEFHPYDLSQAFQALSDSKQIQLMKRLPISFVAGIFEHYMNEEQIALLQQMDALFAVQIIDKMETDDAVDLLRYIEDEDIDVDFVNLLSPKKRAELKKYWSYQDHEIGSVMSNSFIELSKSMTVKEAMKKVTTVAAETDYISILYVLEKKHLVGYLKLKQLIIARASETIGDIMESRMVSVQATDDKESAAQLLTEYGLSSIAIVDSDNHLIGIATHDDLLDVISEAKSEDYRKFAALVADDEALKSDNIIKNVKNRLPWLAILLGLSLLTSVILGLFERQLTGSLGAMTLAASLAIYLPLILDMSGNTGTQSLAVMIRYLTKNKQELTRKALKQHITRELYTGITQGFLIALMVMVIMVLTRFVSKGSLDPKAWVTALVTSASICVALIVSTVNGAIIPLVMNQFKIDPAVASGPFITTVSDIITLTLYYSISLAILLPYYVT